MAQPEMIPVEALPAQEERRLSERRLSVVPVEEDLRVADRRLSDITEMRDAVDPDMVIAAQVFEPASEIAKEVTLGEPECYATDDPDLILRSRQMTAAYYLKREFITKDDIGPDGTMTLEADPHQNNATYYVLVQPETGDIIATSRKIHYVEEKGEASFPLFDHEKELDPKFVEQLRKSGIKNVVEISALVKNPHLDTDGFAALKLYRGLFHDSWDQNRKNKSEEVYVMACNPRLYEDFHTYFDGSVKRIGPDLNYPGQIAVPAMLKTKEGSFELIDRANDLEVDEEQRKIYKMVIHFMFEGMDIDKLDPKLVKKLNKNGFSDVVDKMRAEKTERHKDDVNGWWSDRDRNSKVAAAGMLAWGVFRTTAVAKANLGPGDHTMARAGFGVLEMGTAIPYGYALADVLRTLAHPRTYARNRKLGSAALTAALIAGPYAYVEAAAPHAAASTWEGAAGFAAVALTGAGMRIKEAIKSRRAGRQAAKVVLEAVQTEENPLAIDTSKPQPEPGY